LGTSGCLSRFPPCAKFAQPLSGKNGAGSTLRQVQCRLTHRGPDGIGSSPCFRASSAAVVNLPYGITKRAHLSALHASRQLASDVLVEDFLDVSGMMTACSSRKKRSTSASASSLNRTRRRNPCRASSAACGFELIDVRPAGAVLLLHLDRIPVLGEGQFARLAVALLRFGDRGQR